MTQFNRIYHIEDDTGNLNGTQMGFNTNVDVLNATSLTYKNSGLANTTYYSGKPEVTIVENITDFGILMEDTVSHIIVPRGFDTLDVSGQQLTFNIVAPQIVLIEDVFYFEGSTSTDSLTFAFTGTPTQNIYVDFVGKLDLHTKQFFQVGSSSDFGPKYYTTGGSIAYRCGVRMESVENTHSTSGTQFELASGTLSGSQYTQFIYQSARNNYWDANVVGENWLHRESPVKSGNEYTFSPSYPVEGGDIPVDGNLSINLQSNVSPLTDGSKIGSINFVHGTGQGTLLASMDAISGTTGTNLVLSADVDIVHDTSTKLKTTRIGKIPDDLPHDIEPSHEYFVISDHNETLGTSGLGRFMFSHDGYQFDCIGIYPTTTVATPSDWKNMGWTTTNVAGLRQIIVSTSGDAQYNYLMPAPGDGVFTPTIQTPIIVTKSIKSCWIGGNGIGTPGNPYTDEQCMDRHGYTFGTAAQADNGSTAIGAYSTAVEGEGDMVFGRGSTSEYKFGTGPSGSYNMIVGHQSTITSSNDSCIFGETNTLLECENSYCLGIDNNISNTEHSTVIGRNNAVVQGDWNYTLGGYNTTSASYNQYCIGRNNDITGNGADGNFLFGLFNTTNESSRCMNIGESNTLTSGISSYVIGNSNDVSASAGSYVMGILNDVIGGSSNEYIIGTANTLDSTDGFAGSQTIIGKSNISTGSYESFTIGVSNEITSGSGCNVIGYTNVVTDSSISILGAFNNSTGSDGSTIGVSNTTTSTSGTFTFGHTNNISASDENYTLGSNNTASGSKKTYCIGRYNDIIDTAGDGGYGNYSFGYNNTIHDSMSSMAIGYNISMTGENQVVKIGAKEVILSQSLSGGIFLENLPSSTPPGTNQLWNDSGTLKIT